MLAFINYHKLSEEQKISLAKETKSRIMLRRLAKEPNFDIRYAVYYNPRTSKRFRKKLQETDIWIRIFTKGFLVSRMNDIWEFDLSG